MDKNNLHHAYLFEGARDEVMPEIIRLMKELGIKTAGNPDFLEIAMDTMKIEDARNLRTYSLTKGTSGGKKIFVVSANNFLLEAQNTLLKVFEEPTPETHFFVILPDVNVLLPTLASRFYQIIPADKKEQKLSEAKKFISLSGAERIEFLKDLLAEENFDEEEVLAKSARAKALDFLNALEVVLHEKFLNQVGISAKFFNHIFTVRESLRMPGSSPKTLMESVALAIPGF